MPSGPRRACRDPEATKSTEDQQDPESSRGWQLTRSRTLIEPRVGVIVAEFFDVDKSRSIPWQRRPHATALLAELKNPDRGFDAVVIGEPHRAFYGNQYGLTFPLFEHYGVPLWVPEVGGPIDPGNAAPRAASLRAERLPMVWHLPAAHAKPLG
jgi:site-specific DNA recombinase